jgi:O-antigen biosynthesis protein
MPFDRDGKWIDPSQEQADSFLKKLQETPGAISEIALPVEIQEELLKSVREKGIDFKNIERLNRTSYKALANVALDPGLVSIVIPVYGALHLVKKCIESVFQHTVWPFELIIVDDCSPDPEVANYLNKLEIGSKKCSRLEVLFNQKNKGFAATCNRGMRIAEGKYICVLNSDVLVTPYWLTKMVCAIEADKRNVIVNPCTNNTALINVPMEPGRSYLDMNRALERKSPKNYPEIMPTGFCLFFRKSLLKSLGGFDEAYISYGEDTHFWFQSLKLTDKNGEYLGNRAVMADDCYIFHERSSSFNQVGKDEHMGLRRSGSERFHALNPSFVEWKDGYDLNRVMRPLKEATSPELFNHEYKYNVAWVVKSAAFCGGMKYITDIANELIERNVNVKICVIKNSPEATEAVLNDLHTAPIFFKDAEDFVTNFSLKAFTNGVVIAAVAELVEPVGRLCHNNSNYTPIHHVQSYDPALTNDPQLAAAQGELYGKLQHTISSSNWITETLVTDHQVNNILFTTQPGIDTDIFHKGNRNKGDDRFTVMINLDAQYPFKGAARGIELCKELVKLDPNIRILGLGMDFVQDVPTVVGLGKLSQGRLAQLLRTEVDVFVDPSYVHSYGMPSLEALTSGVEIVCWNNQGVLEYANNSMPGVHIFLPNIPPIDLAIKIAEIKDHHVIPSITHITRKESVSSFIEQFESQLGLCPFNKKITVITPHARKHGGPTTIINLANVLAYIGHDVKLVSIYDDFSQEVIGFRKVPLYVGIDRIQDSDIVIINSDNPFAEEIIHQPALKNAKKILLKLSHNPRFKAIEEATLRMPVWDKIVTSTDHLKQKTVKPLDDWRHIAWNPEKVQTLGWYHYTFPLFNAPPATRQYGHLNSQVRIGYLMHDHPTKGTNISNAIVKAVKRKYQANVDIIAVGEVKLNNQPNWLTYIFRPTRPQMAQVMKQCDIWLSSSLSEGLGRMNLEAMAAGCVVVSSDTGAEFLKNGENCLLYPAGDAQAGGQTLDRLISSPQEAFMELAKKGHETAEKAADPTQFILNLRNLIYELCK